MKSCTHFVLLLCVSHPTPSLMTAGAPTLDDTHYNQVSQHALSLVVQLLWQLHDNLTGFGEEKKEKQWMASINRK